jgi:hypothetical protein
MTVRSSNDKKNEKDTKKDLPFEQESNDKKEVKKEKVKEETVSEIDASALSPEQVKMVDELVDKKMKERETKPIIIDTSKQDKGARVYPVDELPKDDYLEDPVVFFAYSYYYSIFGDKRKGQLVSTPFNRPVKFKVLFRSQKRDRLDKGADTVTVSQAIINSKKEVEWLRQHSLYGIKFFESIKKAQSVDVTLAEKMVEVSAMVSSMDDVHVVDRANKAGIEIDTPDISYLRQSLTKKLAEEAIAVDKEKLKVKLQDVADRKTEEKKPETSDVGNDPY